MTTTCNNTSFEYNVKCLRNLIITHQSIYYVQAPSASHKSKVLSWNDGGNDMIYIHDCNKFHLTQLFQLFNHIWYCLSVKVLLRHHF